MVHLSPQPPTASFPFSLLPVMFCLNLTPYFVFLVVNEQSQYYRNIDEENDEDDYEDDEEE